MSGSSIDGSTSWSSPGRTLASVVRFTTAWNDSRAVLPMICRSSSAEPTPGTCTRIRSVPWRWIVGSRVPASSTRRRTISRLCCIVRVSSAAFCAAVSVTTSWSPSARASNSRLPAPVSEKTGLATSAAAASAAFMPAGLPIRTRSSSGPASSRRTLPTSSLRSRSLSRSSGQMPSSCWACTSAVSTCTSTCAPPRRSSPRFTSRDGRNPGQSPMSCSSSGVSGAPRSTALRASFAPSTRP